MRRADRLSSLLVFSPIFSLQSDPLAGFGEDLGADAEEAIRLVSGMLRRGEGGEAFRERRQAFSWTVSEAGLLAPASSDERGTAVRIRRGRESLLVARPGDGPEALREAVREASRRAGSAPFFKAVRRLERQPRGAEPWADDDAFVSALTSSLAAALAEAVPDPRGVAISLVVSHVTVKRAVITSRAFAPCGASSWIEASGTLSRSSFQRTFAFQSARPYTEAFEKLARSLHEAARPMPHLSPPDGVIDVVLAPAASAVFWHEVVGHALEAESGEKASVLARVPGAVVAPPGFDVLDDPSRSDLPGGYAVDDEGTPGRAVPLLSNGRVAGVLTDKRTAGAESNGHGRTSDFRRPPRARLSNLVVPAGRAGLSELLKRCDDGLYVREVSAGSCDPESGRFVLLVEHADTIRRGRPGAPVARFALMGEVLAALRNLDGERGDFAMPSHGLSLCVKGGDPLPVGGEAPAVLIRDLVVRGARA